MVNAHLRRTIARVTQKVGEVGMIWDKDKQETVGVTYGLHHVDYITIVRCKDCKNGGIDSISYPHYWCSAHSEYHDADWFCADGKRKD